MPIRALGECAEWNWAY